MVIPVVTSHKRVINQPIICSDTVLNLNSLGKNLKLKLTTIHNIDEELLSNCLTTIFKENTQVTFHTIQYSKRNKKLYFYTDTYISTFAWEQKRLKSIIN